MQETFSLQDCLFYDDASSNKISNYSTVQSTFSHDTDHYVSVSDSATSSTSTYFAFVYPNANLNLPRNLKVDIDIKQTANFNGQWGVSFTDSHGTNASSTKYCTCGGFKGTNETCGIIYNSPWGANRGAGMTSLNTWYHMEITVNGTTVSLKVTDGDTVVYNKSVTVSFMSSLTNFNIHQAQATNTLYFKNLKIKAL